MKTKILLALTLIMNSITTYSQSYNWVWAKSAGGIGNDYANAIATDQFGNVYVTGNFQAPTIIFGAVTLNNADGINSTDDIFLVKYNAAGALIWAKSFGGLGNDLGHGIATDLVGNVFITGNYASDSINFGMSTIMNTSSGIHDMYLAKFDSSGTETWAFGTGSNSYDECYSVVTDSLGSSYVTGIYAGSSINFGTFLLSNSGLYSTFTSKFDFQGNVLWAKKIGGSGAVSSQSLCVDKSLNVYVTGSFNLPTLSFGASSLINAGSSDIFIAKYNPSGNEIWAVQNGGTDYDEARSITTDQNGKIYSTGLFQSLSIAFGSTTLNGRGGYDIYIAKYDSAGNVEWAKGSTGLGIYDIGYSVSSNYTGIIVCGTFSSDTIVFDSDTLLNSSPSNNPDVFIVSYDFAGNLNWAKSIGGNNSEQGNSIASDNANNYYVAGSFASANVYFGSSIVNNFGITGSPDIFIAKLQFSGVGINELNHNNSFELFPNPANDFIELKTNLKNNASFYLYDMAGKAIINQSLEKGKKIYINAIVPGIYVAEVIGNNGISIKRKFIKQ